MIINCYRQNLLGALLTDDELVEPTANLLGSGELVPQVGAAPAPTGAIPILLITTAATRNPNHIYSPDGARACTRRLPRLAPDLRRLPSAVRGAGPAVGLRVLESGGDAGQRLRLPPPEVRPWAAIPGALVLLLRGDASRVDAARC